MNSNDNYVGGDDEEDEDEYCGVKDEEGADNGNANTNDMREKKQKWEEGRMIRMTTIMTKITIMIMIMIEAVSM